MLTSIDFTQSPPDVPLTRMRDTRGQLSIPHSLSADCGTPPRSDTQHRDHSAARQSELAAAPVTLRLLHVSKSYPIESSNENVVALRDITLNTVESSGGAAETFGSVRQGEFLMIRGPSGGGKTTLLNIIGTIDSCTDGVVELNGVTIDKNTPESHLADIRLRTLGFVFQTFNLIPTMSAAENVELPMTLLGKLSAKEIRLRARQLLTLVGLRNRVNHLPSELSGGEQQRVTIARSLANSPSLLLLDEPTGDLDTANTIEVMDLLVRINRLTRTTCIMVTHNPDIECYADRVLYVSDGRFVREVRNAAPCCLDLVAYGKYVEAKELALMAATDREEEEGATTGAATGSPVSSGLGRANLKESPRLPQLVPSENPLTREDVEARKDV